MRRPFSAMGKCAIASAILLSIALLPSTSLASTQASEPGVDQPYVGESETAEVVEELTTATSTTYQLDDLSMRSVISSGPVNYQDTTGEWDKIDNTLVPAPGAAYEVRNEANDYTVSIPSDASTDPVKFAAAGRWVTFKLNGIDGAPDVQNSSATFEDVEDAETVTYEATALGVKESIQLAMPPSEPISYVFEIGLSQGLIPRLSDSQTLDIVDGQQVVHFTIPAAFMYDSTPLDPAYSDDVRYSLNQAGSAWHLEVTPSYEWLTNPSRTYPIIIDPTITDEPLTDCWISSGNPTGASCSAPVMRVGYDASGPYKRRALIKFDLSGLAVDTIVSATDLALYLDSTQTEGSGLADYSIKHPGAAWTNQATWNSPVGTASQSWAGGDPGSDAFSVLALNGSTSGFKHWTPDTLVREWLTGARPNKGFLLMQNTESVSSSLAFRSASASVAQSYWPTLTIEYVDNERSMSPITTETQWLAMLDCMKDGSEVGSATTMAEAFGSVTSDGTIVGPTGPPASPSDACVFGAANLVIDTLDQAPSSSTPEETLSTLKAGLESGSETVTPGTSLPNPELPAYQDPDSKGCTMTLPRPSFLYFMELYFDKDMDDWIPNSNHETPCYFDWDDDVCSISADSGDEFNFTYSCKRHDFAYRNLKLWERKSVYDAWRERNKRTADTGFRRDMGDHCSHRWFTEKPGCYVRREAYYAVVAYWGWDTYREWEHGFVN